VKGKQSQTPSKPKNKKAQQEEAAIEMFNMDSDDDEDDDSSSGEEQILQKTPQNKTPKGKQVQSDKKVTFQLQGKNTPGNKTASTKKQPTPGKTALQKFNGIKQKAQESDDDEDDDEDNDEDMVDLDNLLGDDDDDEDDDDDDEGDDDDDDEDDDDEQPLNKPNSKNLSQAKNKSPTKNEKTPVKSEKTVIKSEKTPMKNEKTPAKNEKMSEKAKTPVKVVASKQEFVPTEVKKVLETTNVAIRERNLRTLFLGSLPNDVTETEIKALSNDIVFVKFPQLNKNRKTTYAFVEFKNEAKAEENFQILQKKKLRGETLLHVDYTGEKSQKRNQSASRAPQSVNLRKLFVTSLPLNVTMADIGSLFPGSCDVHFNNSKEYRTAAITYPNEKLAAQELEVARGSKISGMPITVMYSHGGPRKIKKRNRKGQSSQQRPAKKMKVEDKQESDDSSDE